jgi:hypothetical protein
METFSALGRRKIRYWCFRLHTESIGAAKADGCPEGLREYFEAHMWFLGWKNYGVTWDVAEKNPLEIVPLKKSLEETWNSEANSLARDLPTNN